ncbi:hypothetical protein LNAOJCKE_4859 [Methylorubrum aminovorans]|jgi:hypothetical protein|uniref:Uncharacterized protein n=2 Tax=Methylorubrum TaxID=2282523 RepID=A0AA40S7K3_9HYPH|nr:MULTISPECIES: hypothetical protein [Methylorubrum]MBA8916046.1 hypothetical protein [Methylorubrum thiocyanatum]UGB28622.1 hypothetical protein LPC10_25060 [Methylorubrum sp. B1-46]GJE67627.1 hypothetical protein LNAOJCKE_4859 [Methylorubrum aminovorans]GJE82239.1 hypothetical protein CJNNKLLH_3602 [Methylorubrum thiocyanatum]GMA80042.1 hypothetical protein GCM10025880_64590 [Methylorubrum aminovorans]
MTRTTTNNRPSHAVYVVEGEGENAFWTRIGAAWAHEDGDGFNLQLSCLPLTGRLVIRKPRPKTDGELAQ